MSDFQVGDTVKYVALDNNAIYEDGLIGKVVSCGEYSLPTVLWENGKQGVHSVGYVELVRRVKQDSSQYAAGTIDAHYRQEGGSHYTDMKIQPIDYIMANDLDYLAGNVVKYVSRHKAKGGAEDIRKAIHYCEMILQRQYA